jgi:hypothetical protein
MGPFLKLIQKPHTLLAGRQWISVRICPPWDSMLLCLGALCVEDAGEQHSFLLGEVNRFE